MTITQAKHICRLLGYSLNRKDGEFRVCRHGADEIEAYYTDDAQDAVDTAKADFIYRAEREQQG